MKELGTLVKKSSWGGVRENSGRPLGSLNKNTREEKEAERLFKERILENIQELLNAQMNIAKGASYLFKIVEEKSSTGAILSRYHKLVEDPAIIKEVLDEMDGMESANFNDDYYYITTKAPDNKALISLIDRVFGKAKQSVELGTSSPDTLIGLIMGAK